MAVRYVGFALNQPVRLGAPVGTSAPWHWNVFERLTSVRTKVPATMLNVTSRHPELGTPPGTTRGSMAMTLGTQTMANRAAPQGAAKARGSAGAQVTERRPGNGPETTQEAVQKRLTSAKMKWRNSPGLLSTTSVRAMQWHNAS